MNKQLEGIFKENSTFVISGFDSALMGYATVQGEVTAVYSREDFIDLLRALRGCTYPEALIEFQDKFASTDVGPGTPIFLTRIKEI
jgi:hypothetical protein